MTVARTVGDVLRDHVTLEVECVDRLYLNVYQPLMDPITKEFLALVHRFARTSYQRTHHRDSAFRARRRPSVGTQRASALAFDYPQRHLGLRGTGHFDATTERAVRRSRTCSATWVALRPDRG